MNSDELHNLLLPMNATNPILVDNEMVTMEITYRFPDYKNICNTFLWQFGDVQPDYPRLLSFLNHWQNNIEATAEFVRVWTTGSPIAPAISHLRSENIIIVDGHSSPDHIKIRWWE